MISVPCRRLARLVADGLASPRQYHSGLFHVREGYYRGRPVVVICCSGDENVHYASVRHIAALYRLAGALLVEPVRAVAETPGLGTVVLGTSARRYYCPTALPGNMDGIDDLVFRGEALRQWLAEPPVAAAMEAIDRLAAGSREIVGGGALCQDLVPVRVGSSARPLRGWRAAEFVRTHFEIDVVDTGAFGFLRACSDVSIAGCVLGVVTEACSTPNGERLGRRRIGNILRSAALQAADFLPRHH